MRKPPTGEPYAGKPHVRFGGRGEETLPDPYCYEFAPPEGVACTKWRARTPALLGKERFALFLTLTGTPPETAHWDYSDDGWTVWMADMPADDEPRIAAREYAKLAELSLAQARATLHRPTARVLKRMAEKYAEKAEALGSANPPSSRTERSD